MSNKKAMFTSKNRSFETPQDLFKELNWFYQFNVDLCASRQNHLLPDYYFNDLVVENGIARYKRRQRSVLDEIDFNNKRGFFNPPYGKSVKPCLENCAKISCIQRGWHTSVTLPGIAEFLDHLCPMVEKHKGRFFFVALLPARVDVDWWQKHVIPQRIKGGVTEIPGRLKFGVNGKSLDPAPFPSALVLFK